MAVDLKKRKNLVDVLNRLAKYRRQQVLGFQMGLGASDDMDVHQWLNDCGVISCSLPGHLI